MAMKSFLIDEQEWFEEIGKLVRANPTRSVWAIFRSGFLEMIATECLLELDGRRIDLLLPPQAPQGHPAIGISVFLPEKGEAEYDRRFDETGAVQLRMLFLASNKLLSRKSGVARCAIINFKKGKNTIRAAYVAKADKGHPCSAK
jgi:hypothetical protein